MSDSYRLTFSCDTLSFVMTLPSSASLHTWGGLSPTCDTLDVSDSCQLSTSSNAEVYVEFAPPCKWIKIMFYTQLNINLCILEIMSLHIK